jgi:hypothetical protein
MLLFHYYFHDIAGEFCSPEKGAHFSRGEFVIPLAQELISYDPMSG